MSKNPIPFLVAATLIVALLSTLLVPGGWLMWLPVVLALSVSVYAGGSVRR